MRKHRGLRIVAVASVLALALAACGGDDDDDDASGSDSTTTTAGEATAATATARSTSARCSRQTGITGLPRPADDQVRSQMAVEEINAAGGVNGKQVVLVEQRRRHRPRRRQRRGSTPAEPDNVDVDRRCRGVGRDARVIDKIMTTPVVAVLAVEHRPAVHDLRRRRLLLPHRTARQPAGAVLADLIIGDGKSKVAILARSDEYGEGFADALEKARGRPAPTCRRPVLYDPEARDFQADAQQIADATPDAVVVIGSTRAARSSQAAIAAGCRSRRRPVVRHRRHAELHVLREGRPDQPGRRRQASRARRRRRAAAA